MLRRDERSECNSNETQMPDLTTFWPKTNRTEPPPIRCSLPLGGGNSMRRTVLAAMMGALLCATLHGQPRGERTAGMVNGRAWLIFTGKMRTSFLAGFTDGIGVYSCGSDQFKSVKASTLSIGESKKMLDDFYNDPANISIPIAAALELVADRAAGASRNEYERLLFAARRVADRSGD